MNKNQLRYADWLTRVMLQVKDYAKEGPVITYNSVRTDIMVSGTSLVRMADHGKIRHLYFSQHFPSVQQLIDYLPLFGFTILLPVEGGQILIKYNNFSVGLLSHNAAA